MKTHVIPAPEALNPDCGNAATEQLRNVVAGQKVEIAALRAELATLKREARETLAFLGAWVEHYKTTTIARPVAPVWEKLVSFRSKLS